MRSYVINFLLPGIVGIFEKLFFFSVLFIFEYRD